MLECTLDGNKLSDGEIFSKRIFLKLPGQYFCHVHLSVWNVFETKHLECLQAVQSGNELVIKSSKEKMGLVRSFVSVRDQQTNRILPRDQEYHGNAHAYLLLGLEDRGWGCCCHFRYGKPIKGHWLRYCKVLQ